jgi:hypothetical protein
MERHISLNAAHPRRFGAEQRILKRLLDNISLQFLLQAKKIKGQSEVKVVVDWRRDWNRHVSQYYVGPFQLAMQRRAEATCCSAQTCNHVRIDQMCRVQQVQVEMKVVKYSRTILKDGEVEMHQN